MNETVPVEEAIGMVLPHDITEIKKEGKSAAFRKGHIIRQEDIRHLKDLGKEHIYVLHLGRDDIHENEAARMLAGSLAGPGTIVSGGPVEGKLTIVAAHDGLLKINVQALYDFNLLGEVMAATLHSNTPVQKNEQLAATRLIPLVGRRALVEEAVRIAENGIPIVRVLPLRRVKAGLVITGNEVYYGRIKDGFEAVLRQKIAQIGSEVIMVEFAPDDAGSISRAILKCLAGGAELIVTSGGMSVDPDDVTRQGIMQAGATGIVYGSPVLPGAMFEVAHIGRVPVIGLPACGMFHRITVFDLILPRVLAGETITREDLAAMGHGGLCRLCKTCRYPVCGFGK